MLNLDKDALHARTVTKYPGRRTTQILTGSDALYALGKLTIEGLAEPEPPTCSID